MRRRHWSNSRAGDGQLLPPAVLLRRFETATCGEELLSSAPEQMIAKK
jgi:hypothetical protein